MSDLPNYIPVERAAQEHGIDVEILLEAVQKALIEAIQVDGHVAIEEEDAAIVAAQARSTDEEDELVSLNEAARRLEMDSRAVWLWVQYGWLIVEATGPRRAKLVSWQRAKALAQLREQIGCRGRRLIPRGMDSTTDGEDEPVEISEIPTYLPLKTAAEQHNLEIDMLSQAIQEGELQAVRVDTEVLVKSEEVDVIVAKHKATADDDELVSLNEAARRLHVDSRTISFWVQYGWLPVEAEGSRRAKLVSLRKAQALAKLRERKGNSKRRLIPRGVDVNTYLSSFRH